MSSLSGLGVPWIDLLGFFVTLGSLPVGPVLCLGFIYWQLVQESTRTSTQLSQIHSTDNWFDNWVGPGRVSQKDTLRLTHQPMDTKSIGSARCFGDWSAGVHTEHMRCPKERKRKKVFYFEQQIKRELKIIHIRGCRCNERLKAKTVGTTTLTYTGLWGKWGVECNKECVFVITEKTRGTE